MQKQSLLIKQNRNVNWEMGFLMQIENLSTMNLKNKQRYEYRMEKLKNKCLEAIITPFFRVKHSNLHWYSRKVVKKVSYCCSVEKKPPALFLEWLEDMEVT